MTSEPSGGEKRLLRELALMKILITGGSGRLGSYLCRKARDKGYETYSNYFSHKVQMAGVEFFSLDISSGDAVQESLARIEPLAIIHCAAITRDDSLENLTRVNVRGTENIASFCEKTGAWLAHISTDLVFDGKKGKYSEEDAVNPSGQYPESKLMAEKRVLESGAPASIVRIPINYGWTRDNSTFVEWILKQVARRQKVPLFSDQYRSPVYLSNLADAILEIMELKPSEIFHLGGPDRVTRYELGLKVAELFEFPEELLLPVRMSEVEFSGSRCADCSFDISKAARLLKTRLLGIDEGLRLLKEEESTYKQHADLKNNLEGSV